MKKLFSCLLTACIVWVVSCKNTHISNPVSTVLTVQPLPVNPDAPPPGTPVLETPEAYNNYITDRQKKVYDYIVQMSDAAAINPADADKVISEAAPQINRLTNEIKAMPPYKGNDAMRDAAIVLFEFYESTFNNRYHQIIDYTKKGNTRTNAEAQQMQELSTAIITEEKRLDTKLKAKQQIFAEANHMIQQPESYLYQQVDYQKQL